MKLAVNYSHALVELLNENSVQLDLIKCPDWEGIIKEAGQYGPITLHYDLEVGLGNTFKIDFSRIQQLQQQTLTPHINTHLVTPSYFNPDNSSTLQEINTLWREEIKVMINHVGANAVALEHYPYTETTPNIRPAADSGIFSQVILDTDCMLLLDLAHARITADTLGIDVKEYICALPLDRLVEMHITGVKMYSGVLTDHFGLQDEDWDILAWALGEIQTNKWRTPEIVAFEYGGVGSTFVWRTDFNVLKTQIPKLYEMIHAHSE